MRAYGARNLSPDLNGCVMTATRKPRPSAIMRHAVTTLLSALLCVSSSRAAEPPVCRTVRLADVGWTDVTATTALTAVLLEGLGYEPREQLLSVPVTFASMRSGDIDVFLGAWMPSMAADLTPYLRDGSVQQVRINLEGAKYTLAVPEYVAQAGVRSFADLATRADRFDRKIYGIETGNDGNRIINTLIEGDTLGLGGWRLIESSEQGMLTQVARATEAREWIVFLGWEPHPMNLRWRLTYLTGGDAWFGPHLGGAVVWTTARAGYLAQCPNVGRFLHNLGFNLDIENTLMQSILTDQMEPREAARHWLRQHPEALAPWLDGVTTFAGAPGRSALEVQLGSSPEASWLPHLPVGRSAASLVNFVTRHFRGEIRSFASVVESCLERIIAFLAARADARNPNGNGAASRCT